MNDSDIIRLTSAVLQFGVACYALRLSRLFNSVRAGWLLFSGLSFLALFYVLLPENPFGGSVWLEFKVDIIYALVSAVLLAGMVHFERRFKALLKTDDSRHQAHARWESQVEGEWAQLNKTNDTLQEANDTLQEVNFTLQENMNRLESELANQAQARELADRNCLESQQERSELLKVNEELRLTLSALHIEMMELRQAKDQTEKEFRDQLAAARQSAAQTAEVALQMTESALASLNAACLAVNRLSASGITPLGQMARLVREHSKDLPAFLTRNSRGRQLADALGRLSRHLSDEYGQLKRKTRSAKGSIVKIRELFAPEQNQDGLSLSVEETSITANAPEGFAAAGVEFPEQGKAITDVGALPVESTPEYTLASADLHGHLINSVTETGTEFVLEQEPKLEAEPGEPERASDSGSTDHIGNPAEA